MLCQCFYCFAESSFSRIDVFMVLGNKTIMFSHMLVLRKTIRTPFGKPLAAAPASPVVASPVASPVRAAATPVAAPVARRASPVKPTLAPNVVLRPAIASRASPRTALVRELLGSPPVHAAKAVAKAAMAEANTTMGDLFGESSGDEEVVAPAAPVPEPAPEAPKQRRRIIDDDDDDDEDDFAPAPPKPPSPKPDASMADLFGADSDEESDDEEDEAGGEAEGDAKGSQGQMGEGEGEGGGEGEGEGPHGRTSGAASPLGKCRGARRPESGPRSP